MWLKPINTRQNVTVEEKEPLSPGARIFHAPQFNCCVIAVAGCKTKIDVEVVKEGIKHTLIKHPRFSSKLVLHPKNGVNPTGWIQTTVTIVDHLIIPDLDPNMDSPDEFIEDYVSNITRTPMDLTKPLWEIHLLNIKTTEANSLAVFRIHHSMGDGISLISLVLSCTRQTANPDALPTLPTDKDKNEKIMGISRSIGFLSCFMILLFIFKLLRNIVMGMVLFMATGLWMRDTNTPVKGGRGIESTPKRFVYRTFRLDDIKLVKRALDVTINDVLLGITQAGLSSYLNRKYGEIKGRKAQKDNLPKRIRLRSSVILNLRPSSTIKDLAEQMESSCKKRWNWGNAIAHVILPFHIVLRDDPLDYIRNAKATIDKKKQSLEAPCTYAGAMILLKTLGLRVTAFFTHRVVSRTTLAFSNMVRPKAEISFYGHPMAFLAPSTYGHPQALTVHFQSYMDKMTLVLAVDENVIPDPKRLCDDIEESLRLVKQAVIEKKLIK